MPSEQLGLRIPDTILSLVRQRGEPGPTVRRDLERYYVLLARGRARLRSLLSDAELAVCLDALNGVLHEAWSMALVSEGIADAIKLEGAAQRHGADPDVLLATLRALDDAARWALVDAAERWWRHIGEGKQPEIGEALRA